MKYLGKETQVEVKTKSVRKIEYVRCDGCGKKILPGGYSTEKNEYVSIHTWHNDWGSESVESHEYNDYCKECAKSFVSTYIDEMHGTEELELKHRHLLTMKHSMDIEDMMTDTPWWRTTRNERNFI